jgi:hypothetical protein
LPSFWVVIVGPLVSRFVNFEKELGL